MSLIKKKDITVTEEVIESSTSVLDPSGRNAKTQWVLALSWIKNAVFNHSQNISTGSDVRELEYGVRNRQWTAVEHMSVHIQKAAGISVKD